MKITIGEMSRTYDADNGKVTSVSYQTSLSTDISVLEAIRIINRCIVNPYLYHMERINGTNIGYGKLLSVTEDIGGECWCFSVERCPNTELLEAEIDIDI
jgi:hypothetical protein